MANEDKLSGFIIIRLAKHVQALVGRDLRELAALIPLPRLANVLAKHPTIISSRLITSITPERLDEIERRTERRRFRPGASLTRRWRLDCRTTPREMAVILPELKALPEVDMAHLEKAVSLPAASNAYSSLQRYC